MAKFGVSLFLLQLLMSGNAVFDASRVQTLEGPAGFSHQFRDGDIIIGGAIEIHRHSSTGECGELRGKGVQDVEAINMLIDKFNANDTILNGIKLGTVLIDTCAWPTHAVKQIVNHVIPFVYPFGNSTGSKSILAGVLGAGTSKVSLQIANLLQAFEVPQISHSSTSQELSDKSLYPYFFRTVSADWYQSLAMVQLFIEMGWNYISVVYENDCYGRSLYLEFVRSAKIRDVCIALAIPIPSVPSDEGYRNISARLLAQRNANVVIIITKSTPAEKVISTTHEISKGKSRLIWVGSDGWATYLPKNPADASYADTLDGSIAFKPHGMHLNSVDEYMTSITLQERLGQGFHVNPWFSELISLQNKCTPEKSDASSLTKCNPGLKLNATTFRSYEGLLNMAHAVEAFVLSLDAYHRSVCNGKKGLCTALSEQAGTNKLASRLYPFLKNVSFPGLNGGYFTFDENQDGPPSYDIMVYKKDNVINSAIQTDGWTRAGKYTNGEISWLGGPPDEARKTESLCSKPCGIGEATVHSGACCWQCIRCTKGRYVSFNNSHCADCPKGEEPNSNKTGCVPMTERSMDYSKAYSIIPLAFGSFGICFATTVAIIFIIHRKSPIIKASGKEMCFFILTGTVLTFCNCFSLTVPASLASCIISRFILAVGPTMMYAALLVKTLRIVIIFKYKTTIPRLLESSLLPCWQIFITLGFMLVQFIVLVVWYVKQNPYPMLTYNEEGAFRSCPGVTTEMIFIGLFYPFLLIVVCTVFATINRNVPIGFNETLFVGFTMYATCVIWVAFLPLFLANSSNTALKITTTSVCLSFSACTVLVCLFVPRCYKVLFCPEENTKKAVMSKPRSTIPDSTHDHVVTTIPRDKAMIEVTRNEVESSPT